MNLSYWEIKSWLTNVDYTIVGSGIVGLNCALQLKQHFPKANILILEKGFLPQGASTKNDLRIRLRTSFLSVIVRHRLIRSARSPARL